MKAFGKFKATVLAAIVATQLLATAQAGEMVPSKGKVTGKNVYAVYTANPFDAQGRPILGLVFRYTEAEQSGTATGTGKFTMSTRNFVEFALDANGALVAKVTGDWIMTGANGDQIWGTHVFYRPLTPPLIMTGTTTVTGGNGRFEGITGESALLGEIFPDPVSGLDAFEYEWEGTTTSVGSNKRK